MSWRTATVALGLVGLGTASAAGVSAQGQETLANAVTRFAQAWVGGDLDTVASLVASEGVHITLDGRDYHVLGRRQAIATLKSFLESRTGVGFDVRRVSELGGTPARGFSDVTWEVVDDESGERLRRTLFLAFVQESGAWRVEDLRVLR